ncbi:MAG: hypothetical protein EAY81_00830 [Bacteroidetes bacterium]|nr:MAG: hypothetical protein EAY81_00830 [Bacteroidota bacterium]
MNVVVNLREIELVENPETLKLFNEDVLTQVEDQRVRRVNLDKAATLAKVSNSKANIVLKTPAGYKRILTKVSGVDATHVWIENRVIIPLAAIYAVDIA